MQYLNTALKIDQLVNYCNENKINLSPAVQRGHVWNLKGRKNLLKNILAKKPIPAIFLYKEAIGSRYNYNILDGKQRLESIILFINNSRDDLRIDRWKEYFFHSQAKLHSNFKVEYDGTNSSFDKLDDPAIRDFREYSIPTIEITLDENTNLDEIISLFVDINQQGVAVSRFNIVKAMCKTSLLLKSAFKLIAIEQRRNKDIYYKLTKNEITNCFSKLKDISRIKENNQKVDRIWERLIDIILYVKSGEHRKPNDILRTFLIQKIEATYKLNSADAAKITKACKFMNEIYNSAENVKDSPLFTDYTHFYTALTSITGKNLLTQTDYESMKKKFISWGEILKRQRLPGWKKSIQTSFKTYREASLRQTSDRPQKLTREDQFLRILKMLS
jgi:hypothetical protein